MNYDINNHKNLTFESLTKLFTEHNIKLTRGGTSDKFPNCCVVTALAGINDTSYLSYSATSYGLSDDTVKRLDSLEVGFEGWEVFEDEEDNYIMKYVEIGKRLYKWSVAQP